MRTHFRLALAVLALSALPAQAATMFYNGAAAESAFNSKIGDLGLSISLSDFTSLGTLGPVSTLSDVLGTGIDFLGLDTSNAAKDMTVGSGVLSLYPASGQFLKVTAAAPGNVLAVGFHFTWTSSFGLFCLDLQESVDSGCTTTVNDGSPMTEFYGVISDDGTPLSSSLIFGAPTSGNGTKILNFGVATAAAEEAPEPRSLLLLGTGLLMVALQLRKRGRRRG